MANSILRTGFGLAALLFLPLLPGCGGDLEEEPFGRLATGSGFGETDEEFLTVLIGGYTDLYGLLGNHNSYWSLQEVSTDEAIIPTRGADWGDGGQWVRVHRHEYLPNEGAVNNAWTKLYGAITTSNRLLEQLPELNSELAQEFLPELRGLRALYYWYLMDLYGNVPLITSFTGGETAPTTRPRAEIYNFVVSELNAIIPLLPEDPAYARITRPVAQAMLAKVYLNAEVYTGQARYAEALALCNTLISSGDFTLEPDYFSNFNTNNSGSRENIMVIPYDQVFGQGFNLAMMTLHYGSQQTFGATSQPWNGYATLQEFYDSYADNDRRKGVPGNQKVRSNFLAGPQFAADGVTPILDPSADDPGGAPLNFTPEINQLAPGAFRQAGARFGKFEFAQQVRPDLSNDFPIFRLADIMLMKAECLLRTGGSTSEALETVNMVRRRNFARNAAGGDENDLTSLSLDNLLAERGREMFLEGYRRQDLIRFGKYNGTWQFKPASAATKNLMPIPFPQIQANPNLVQNPGY